MGLQLWSSLPPTQKFVEPSYASFRAPDIPEIARGGVRVRIIAGKIDGLEGR